MIQNYGFTMRHNRYNYLGLKVFVNYEDEDVKTNKLVKVLKLKKNRINEGLFQYLRANLLFEFRDKLRTSNMENESNEANEARANRLLVSAPVDVVFEI
jgi:hypothetical protein